MWYIILILVIAMLSLYCVSLIHSNNRLDGTISVMSNEYIALEKSWDKMTDTLIELRNDHTLLQSKTQILLDKHKGLTKTNEELTNLLKKYLL